MLMPVASEGPFTRVACRRARSSAGEHSLHTGGVTGSIPVAPTIKPPESPEFDEHYSFQKRTEAEFSGERENELHAKSVQNPCSRGLAVTPSSFRVASVESPKQYGDAKITPKDAHPELTDHGFRSTFRDRTAERTTYPAEVAEMALAHAIDNKVRT